MIKEMHLIWQEGDIETIKSEENLKLIKLSGKEYKTIINKFKAVHRQKCVADLKAKESNDPKAFWNIINRTAKHPNTGNVTIG